MRLATNNNPTEIGSSKGGPQAFQISTSKEAFKILSSGLYNDKVLAIVRELSCNAYDAHVAAGKKDIPFELHLPTTFEPYFSVKDFGIGLSHDDVLSLYCTYFSSAKSHSNEFVGALGLGSKSPFCYTEGFTVISKFQGMERIYSAFINEMGMPEIVLQSEEALDDDEPLFYMKDQNGLEVSFPVKADDCWEFQNKAEVALEFFNPVPRCNVELDINKAEYSIKTPTWGLRVNENTHHTSGIRAIQGMVQYSIGKIDISKMNASQKKLYELPLDIFFNIGELSVAASRETLSNDDYTIANILNALNGISDGFIAQVKEKLNLCKREWEARVLLFSMENAPNLGQIIIEARRAGKFDAKYEHFTFSNKLLKINQLDYRNIKVTEFSRTWRSSKVADKRQMFHEIEASKFATVVADVASGLTLKSRYDAEFEATSEVLFVISDLKFGGELYIHFLLQEAMDNRGDGVNRKKKVYLISRAHKDCDMTNVNFEAKAVIASLGYPEVVLLSTLRDRYKPVIDAGKAPSISSEPGERKVLWFDTDADIHRYREGYEKSGWRDAWQPLKSAVMPKENDVNYYVILKNLKPQEADEREWDFAQDFRDFIQAVHSSKKFNLDLREQFIYGIQATNSLIKNDNWVELTSYVFSTLNEIMDPEKEEQLSLLMKSFTVWLDSPIDFIAKKQPLPPDSPMQIFCNKWDRARKYNKVSLEGLSKVVSAAKERGLYKLEHIVDFSAEWEKLKETYPMLRWADAKDARYSNDRSSQQQDVVDYVRLIDRINNERETEAIVTLAVAIAENLQENTEEKEEVASVN